VIGGTRADTLRGDALDNTLFGKNGSDLMSGDAGMDVFIGGTGQDRLTGGADADVFVYNVIGDLRDTITDFTHGEDIIRLDAGTFRLGSYTGGLLAEQLYISTGNQAADANDRLIYNTTDTTLWYDRDGTGTKFYAALVVDLQNGAILTAADIDVI
jgi:Ca2+-binding RTX toxin-like protein